MPLVSVSLDCLGDFGRWCCGFDRLAPLVPHPPHPSPPKPPQSPPPKRRPVRRAHHEDEDGARQSLLGAPYDENFPEEGEPLPAFERCWPAALIPYMHPATMVAEQSMYWEADPADELSLLELGGPEGGGGGSDDAVPQALLDNGSDDFTLAGGASALAQWPGGDEGEAGGTPQRTPVRGGSWPSSVRSSTPVAVPGGGDRESWSAVAASAPQHADKSSYESGGGLSESFRCGTALRFYRSSSASALKGMLEAAMAQQQQQQQLMWQDQQQQQQQQQGLPPLSWQQGRRPSGSGSFCGPAAPGTPRLEAAPSSSTALTPVPAPPARSSRAAAAAPAPPKGRSPPPRRARGSDVQGTCPFITYATSIVICMAGSLAVWPGVTAFICSVHNPAMVSPCAPRAAPYGRLSGDLFVPAMFVIYALGDVTGRIASSWGPWGRRPPAAASLLLYSLSRMGVVGALLLCHVVTPAPWQLPYMLRTDWWPLGLVLALGLTQGHLLSTACMHAPAVLPPGKEARFGPVTGFCITAGCLAGSVVSTMLVESFTKSVDPPLGWV